MDHRELHWPLRQLSEEMVETSRKMLQNTEELQAFVGYEPGSHIIDLGRRIHELKLVHSMVAAFSEFLSDTLEEQLRASKTKGAVDEGR